MVRLKRPRDDSTSVVRPVVRGSGRIGLRRALTDGSTETEAHCLFLDGYAPDENKWSTREALASRKPHQIVSDLITLPLLPILPSVRRRHSNSDSGLEASAALHDPIL